MLVGEGPRLLTVDRKCSDELILLEHWHVQDRAKAPELDGGHKDGLAFKISRILGDVRNMNRLARLHHAPERSFRAGAMRPALPELGKSWRYPKKCGGADRAIVK